MIQIVDAGERRAVELLSATRVRDVATERRAAKIVDAVRTDRDRALRRFATELDGLVGPLEVPRSEWEAAARGGLDQKTYTWGDEPEPRGRRLANYWHGDFPWRPARGYGQTAAVGGFPANAYGLQDMAGNVWEWTRDWYGVPMKPSGCCALPDPRGAGERESYDPCTPQVRIGRKVIKGGSHLCAPNYCQRYRPAARSPQAIDTSTSHIGFRCVIRE